MNHFHTYGCTILGRQGEDPYTRLFDNVCRFFPTYIFTMSYDESVLQPSSDLRVVSPLSIQFTLPTYDIS